MTPAVDQVMVGETRWTIHAREARDGAASMPAIWEDPAGMFMLLANRAQPDTLAFQFNVGVTFEIDCKNATIIQYTSQVAPVPPETMAHCFWDQVYPRLAAYHGELVLHASGNEVGDQQVLFFGASGSGKSTLGAAMARAGYPLIGDDAIAVARSDDRFAARNAGRHLRLYPDSAHGLFGDAIATSAMAHYSAKKVLEPDVPIATGGARRPITTLLFLATDPGADEPSLTPLEPMDACKGLLEQSFALDPTDGARAASRLEQITALVARCRLFTLAYRRDYAQLPAVVACIAKICASGGPQTAPR